MLKIIKVGTADFLSDGSVGYYSEEDLQTFVFSCDELIKCKLTKYRLINSKGQIASLELKRGVLIGLEILGLHINRVKEVDLNRAIKTTNELPIHSFELDGKNSNCLIELLTIDQKIEFEIFASPDAGKIELLFGSVVKANKVGNVSFYYDENDNLSGIKLIDINFKN